MSNSDTGLQKIDQLARELEQYTGVSLDQPAKSRALTYLLIDCSGSMGSDRKFDQAKAGGKEYAAEAIRKGYSVGLIKFETEASLVLEAQTGLAIVGGKIDSIGLGSTTNMASALNIAVNQLIKSSGHRVIYLVTDGWPDDRDATFEAAAKAKRAGIEIMTLGTPPADDEFLKQLATRSELAVQVETHKLQEGIKSMANLLPDRT